MSKKGCLITIGVAVCVLGGILGLVFYLTGGAVKAADRFLGLLGDGKVHEAYLSTSSTLRAQLEEESFTAAVKRLGLTDYASSSGTTRSVENNVANLEGTVTTKSGGSIPLKMKLVKEEGEWKVFSVTGSEAGVGGDQPKREVPSDEALRRLTKESLLDFNQAVKAKDFKPFHDKIAALWKREITAEGLQKAFQGFIDREVDIAGVRDVNPEFDKPPEIDNEGRLVVSGYYPTKPLRVQFTLKYAYEHPSWKLMGLKVNVKE
jgi:hypothetical protein